MAQLPPPLSHLNCHHAPFFPTAFSRRSLLLSTSSLPLSTAAKSINLPDTTVTDRVFLDFSICSNFFRPDRTVSDTLSTICTESIPIGRIVLGLYGRLVPITASNFKTMCTSGLYRNTIVHKILPGQYFLAGRQGKRERGEVNVKEPLRLAPNEETVDPKAFELKHSKGGILSLSLAENDDEDSVKFEPNYRNVEFLITTGPGPSPDLDNENIVFGSVLEGMDVVTAIGAIPTFKPTEKIRQLNDLARFLGDDRAEIARGTWNKPLKTVYISDCGELQVAKPTLSPPSLP